MIDKIELENVLDMLTELDNILRKSHVEHFLVKNVDYCISVVSGYLDDPKTHNEIGLGRLSKILYPPHGGITDVQVEYDRDSFENLVSNLWAVLYKWDLMRRKAISDNSKLT